MSQFIGTWDGQWKGKVHNKPGDPIVTNMELTFALGAGNDPFVTWTRLPSTESQEKRVHGTGTPAKPTHPVEFRKKDGVIYLSFTGNTGDQIEFHPVSGALEGGNTSPQYETSCHLEKVKQ